MLDLIAPKTKQIGFAYVTDSGSINTVHGELEYYINMDGNVYESFESIIDKYASNLNILKGYSSYNTLSQDEISTIDFTVKADATLTHNVMFMSYLGNIKQAFTDSIMHEMSTAMNTVGNEFSNVFVNLKVNDTLTTLVNASPQGIRIKTVAFTSEQATNTPNQFQSGAVVQFDSVVNSFNQHIIYNEQHIGKDFFIDGNSIINSNMHFDDNTSISESIYNDLYVIANDANITNFTIKE